MTPRTTKPKQIRVLKAVPAKKRATPARKPVSRADVRREKRIFAVFVGFLVLLGAFTLFFATKSRTYVPSAACATSTDCVKGR